MNRRPGYRFVQVPGFRIVMCKRCHTHIAVDREAVYFDGDSKMGFFAFTVNLEYGTRWNIGNDTLIKMHCYGCRRHMGSQFVHVEVPTPTIKVGTVKLFLKKLQLLTGEGILEATTLITPVPEPAQEPESSGSS